MCKTITQLVKEGLFYPSRFIGGRMAQALTTADDLKPGQGGIVDMNGKKVAAFRDPAGKLILHSAVCTHLGCIVGWNDADKTFDCPCHGSRFNADGTLKNGPAQRGLDPV